MVIRNMLRIGRSENNGVVVFAVSGRVEEKDVSELRKLFETPTKTGSTTLDLEEVRLVDRGAVRFLAACEARGVKLKNCPSYIREWIETGSDTGHEQRC